MTYTLKFVLTVPGLFKNSVFLLVAILSNLHPPTPVLCMYSIGKELDCCVYHGNCDTDRVL